MKVNKLKYHADLITLDTYVQQGKRMDNNGGPGGGGGGLQ